MIQFPQTNNYDKMYNVIEFMMNNFLILTTVIILDLMDLFSYSFQIIFVTILYLLMKNQFNNLIVNLIFKSDFNKIL